MLIRHWPLKEAEELDAQHLLSEKVGSTLQEATAALSRIHGASHWWCHGGKRIIQREVDRELRGYKEEQARKRLAQEEREVRAVEHYEHNCRAIGGEVAYINTSKGERVVCHSKTGGIIPVPT
jgi:hypothetical protein